MNEIKKIALQTIVLSMGDIREEISSTGDEDSILKFSEAMEKLSEAFKNVKRS